MPAYISLAAIGIIIAAWWALGKHLDLILRGCLYLFVPYAIYAASAEPVYWMTGTLNRCYNASFFIFEFKDFLFIKFSLQKLDLFLALIYWWKILAFVR